MARVKAATSLLIGIFLETLLTGAFLVVAQDCARVLYQRAHKRHQATYRYLIATFLLLTLFIVTRTVVDVESLIRAYSDPDDPGRRGDISEIVLSNALTVTITILADVFLVYRVYIVWNFAWVIVVLPASLCLGEIGGGIYAVYGLAASASGITPKTSKHISRGWTIYLYFTLVTNLLCTLLIAGRIYWIRRRTKASRATAQDNTGLLVTLVVESAAVFSAILIPEIICTVYTFDARFIFINIIGPVVGIVFSYLIIRATQHGDRSFDSKDRGVEVTVSTHMHFSDIDHNNPRPASFAGGRSSQADTVVLQSFKSGTGSDIERGKGNDLK
ncbi:hypothetical protein AURDEDRAFT_151550 [Auricularia subglabra TFB-10046 SS5]|nr:hypothetical protein AURDEDRAFT_151550 [Auricularia subglabra TFB-10046 SS5]